MRIPHSCLRSLGVCLCLKIEIAWIDLQLLANSLERLWVRALQSLVSSLEGRD